MSEVIFSAQELQQLPNGMALPGLVWAPGLVGDLPL
jgi:hypothetical protein